MKILFVWTGVTSYMADCWRELSSRDCVELKVVIVRHSSGSEIDVAGLFGDVDVCLVDDGSVVDVKSWTPDVLFAVGWHSRTVRMTVTDSRLASVPKVCCFDMPWRWMLRCIAARWVLSRYQSNFSAAYVPGSAAARYAKWLGFDRVYTGLFSLNSRRFPSMPGKYGFMYVGRDAPEKRLDVIKRAYDRYREMGGSWVLDIYGGDNFIQPSEIPSLYSSHACLLLASSFDPWPLVLLEAMSAGCPIVASDRCTNRPELGANWIVFRHGDAEGLARALLERDSLTEPRRAEMRRENRRIARAYDCSNWADKVLALSREISLEGR